MLIGKRRRARAHKNRAAEELAVAIRDRAIEYLGSFDNPEAIAGLLTAVEEADAALDLMGSMAPRRDIFAIPGGDV